MTAEANGSLCCLSLAEQNVKSHVQRVIISRLHAMRVNRFDLTCYEVLSVSVSNKVYIMK